MIDRIITWLENEADFTRITSSSYGIENHSYESGRAEEAQKICRVIKNIIQENQKKLASSTSEFYQPLTLTEAILHAENVAYNYDGTHEDMCADCRKQHEQLAEWLKELKKYKRKELEEQALPS